MEYNIVITITNQALLIPDYFKPESGVRSVFSFDVIGLDQLQRHFPMKYIEKFVGTIVGYAIRGCRNIHNNIRKGFYDIVKYLENTQFIQQCLVLGQIIKQKIKI